MHLPATFISMTTPIDHAMAFYKRSHMRQSRFWFVGTTMKALPEQAQRVGDGSAREGTSTRVAEMLKSEIAGGHFAIGQLLPTELELQQRFKVSRYAVREALKKLKEQGLIYARAGHGTVVQASSPQKQAMRGEGLLKDLTVFAEATRLQVIAKHSWVADDEWAVQFNTEPGQQWAAASILRYLPDGQKPIALLQLFVKPEHSDVFDRVGATGGPVFSLLESLHGVQITEVRQQIVAVTIDPTIAVLLECAVSSPALNITRHYFDQSGSIVLLSVGRYPSDRFIHDTRFSTLPVGG